MTSRRRAPSHRVASLNFRHAADGYPTSLIDINYATRWVKARARDLKIDPNRVGIAGQSRRRAIRPATEPRHISDHLAASPPAIGMKEKHDTYWKTEAAMTEGNPLLLLERGEKVAMPPALWVQGRPDIVHDYHDDDSDFPGNEPERFVSNYRKAGGDIEIVYVDNEKRSTSASSGPIAAFFRKHLG